MVTKQIVCSFFISSFSLLSCNKEIRTSYSIDSLDKNRLLIIEDEVSGYEYICGNYVGVIKNSWDDSLEKVRMILLPNSCFEVLEEDLDESDSKKRIRGTYTVDYDTLILHHIIETKKFLVKNNQLQYLPEYCPAHEGLTPKDANTILYKID